MRYGIIGLTLLFLNACALFDDGGLVAEFKTCDLPDSAICEGEIAVEAEVNDWAGRLFDKIGDTVDQIDTRVCLQVETQCPTQSGYRTIDCTAYDCGGSAFASRARGAAGGQRDHVLVVRPD